ncbi:MAG TPA: hypothetical protein VJ691_02525, partial [Vicinamibacterales bacterium]|nr:hypothetical protein [Vicinamibacterales bacterium]
ARALGQRVVALEPQWRNIDPSLTTIGMGSFLWAVHDLPGFNPTIASYRSQLLSEQDASGTWSGGNLQNTAYVALGLGAVGGTGTSAAIESAATFFIANQLADGGWPFDAGSSEFSTVDSEIIRAIDLLFSTGAGLSVTVSPAQLASVTFESVATAGITTVVATPATSQARLPNGYSLVPELTYEAATTATVSGSTVMCVSVPWNAIGDRFADVRLLQVRGGSTKNARYEDVTILDGAFAPDATAKRVCGRLFSLAPVYVSLRTPR